MNDLNKLGITALTFSSLILPPDYYSQYEPKYRDHLNDHCHFEKVLYPQANTNIEAIIEDNGIDVINSFHTLKEFVSKLVNNSKQVEQDFADALEEGYWELI